MKVGNQSIDVLSLPARGHEWTNGTGILSCRRMKQGKHPEQPQCSTQHNVLGRARQADAAILLTTITVYFLYSRSSSEHFTDRKSFSETILNTKVGTIIIMPALPFFG